MKQKIVQKPLKARIAALQLYMILLFTERPELSGGTAIFDALLQDIKIANKTLK